MTKSTIPLHSADLLMIILFTKTSKQAIGTRNNKPKTDLEEAFKQIECWIDTRHLKLKPDKTEYILFGSQAQLKKISPGPLSAHGDLIEISIEVTCGGGFWTKNSISNNTLRKSKKRQ